MSDSRWDDLKAVLRVPRKTHAQAADDVDQEIRFHLDRRAQVLMNQGMEGEEARRRALEEFGDLAEARRALARASAGIQRRNRRGTTMDQTMQDLRYSVRKLTRSPGFTATAMVTLALAIGATTAVFTLVRGVLLRPLELPEPERVVGFWHQRPFSPATLEARWTTWGAEPIRSYESLAGWSSWTVTLSRPDGSIRLQGARTTAEYFRVLGVGAALGRTFAAGEDRPGKGRVAVLSHGLWQSSFGGDASVVGSSILVEGAAHTVIGVMPVGFDLPRPGVQIWLPYEMSPDRGDWRASFLNVVGRLRRGVTLADAQSELDDLVAAVKENYDVPEDFGVDATVTPLRETLVGDSRDAMGLLLGSVGLVLLLAAINLALLNLGRALGRRNELAVRVALGAGRGRLVRQVLTEALILGGLGGGVGVALAYAGLDSLLGLMPEGTPRLGEVSIDTGVLAFALALTLGASLVFGVLPALLGAREGVRASRRGSSEGVGAAKLRSGLVVVEVAFTVTLLVGAGLLLRSFRRATTVDPGFDPKGVLVVPLSPQRSAYQGSPERSVDFFDRLLAETRAIPGVESAGLIQVLPMAGTNRGGRIVLEDRPQASGDDAPSAEFRVVSQGYFRTLRIPVSSGRRFDARDRRSAPAVAMVNQALARRYWPGEDPLGRRIQIPLWRDSISHKVVGVVGNVRHGGLTSEAVPEVYIPRSQYPREIFFRLVVRGATDDPLGLAPAVRQRVWGLDPTVAMGSPETMERVVARTVSQPRLLAGLLTGFSAVSVLLAAMGVHGVMAYRVGRRTREIAIRVALGEGRRRVRRRILGSALGLGVMGTLLGVGGALALQRVLSGFLYQVSPRDPWTLALVSVGALVVAVVAGWVPALRATRVQPADALRME